MQAVPLGVSPTQLTGFFHRRDEIIGSPNHLLPTPSWCCFFLKALVAQGLHVKYDCACGYTAASLDGRRTSSSGEALTHPSYHTLTNSLKFSCFSFA